MAGVNEFVKQVVGDVGSGVFADGYDAAASISLSLLSEKIEGLYGQIKSGRYLSEPEQHLLVTLEELRSDLEAALAAPWGNDGGE